MLVFWGCITEWFKQRRLSISQFRRQEAQTQGVFRAPLQRLSAKPEHAEQRREGPLQREWGQASEHVPPSFPLPIGLPCASAAPVPSLDTHFRSSLLFLFLPDRLGGSSAPHSHSGTHSMAALPPSLSLCSTGSEVSTGGGGDEQGPLGLILPDQNRATGLT